MATQMQVSARREFRVSADPRRAFALLADVPNSASHYPKVKNLVDLGNGAYRWEMQEVGVSGFSHQVVYACRYQGDETQGTVTWTPIEGEGNSKIAGSWKIAADGDGARLGFETTGDLSVPVPWLLRSVVGPFIEREFNQQIDTYVENLTKALC
jgi:carbon monoxide dehydrogenase subunit G